MKAHSQDTEPSAPGDHPFVRVLGLLGRRPQGRTLPASSSCTPPTSASDCPCGGECTSSSVVTLGVLLQQDLIQTPALSGHVRSFRWAGVLTDTVQPRAWPFSLARPPPPSSPVSPLPAALTGAGAQDQEAGVSLRHSDFFSLELRLCPPPLSSFPPTTWCSVSRIACKYDMIIGLISFSDATDCGSLWLRHQMIHVQGLILKEDSGAEPMSLCSLWLLRAGGLRALGLWPAGQGWAALQGQGSTWLQGALTPHIPEGPGVFPSPLFSRFDKT